MIAERQMLTTVADDPNFPARTWQRITALVQGAKSNDMSDADWSFHVRAEAAIIHFYSPYPEVRSVTVPYDDPNTPCETIRVYVIGTIFIIGSTALNSFFHPRQPAITLGPNVLQLLVYPLGWLAAKILPDWGFTFRGSRHSLNPGPWSFKEQVFSVIFFDVTSGFANLYDIFLVQRLPRYLKQDWVTTGYELCLGFSVQFLGFSYAGLLRRFAVFPVTALWPSVLPTLVLSRALTVPERKETVNGWRLTRYTFFGVFALAMFVWFWIPNFFFQALRDFNWMTWIAPQNFNLATITGFYGGLGYNPWSTFDYNVSGAGKLTTPFFSTLQSTLGMMVSGLILIGMYYTNLYWTAYLPINSNTVYDNTGATYTVAKVLDANGNLDAAKYAKYGPPYYSAYNIFQHGQSYAWNALVVVYINIRYWREMKRAIKGIAKSFVSTASVYAGHNDAQIRLYRHYPEVPEWWFLVMLVGSFGIGVAAVTAWPTQTPWWSIIIAMALTAVCIVPMTFILGQANISIETTGVLQILSSVLFPRNINALLIFSTFGTNNLDASRTYASDVKLGLYARIPPRTLFRGQMWSVFLQTFVFVVMIDWLTTSFDVGALCQTNNPDHFVCNAATHQYGNAVEIGMFGAPVVFSMYPILPWCFLIGSIIGISWAVIETQGPRFKDMVKRRCRDRAYRVWDILVFKPFHFIGYINPTIFWSGAHQWGGAANLCYQWNGLYASFAFMYHIKRRYPAWWEKYNYLLQMSFDVGVALSGLVQTLASKFGPRPISAPNWWGNNVSTAGIDYTIYNSQASLKKVPKGGYFGLAPDQYPSPF